MKRRTLFKGATILSMDEKVGDLAKGDLLVEGERIEAIAPELEAGDAEVVDAAGKILCPGFIDGHRHTWQMPLHGVRTDWNFLDYMTFIRSMYCVCYAPEDAQLANWVGAFEALDSGITTLVDHSHLQLSEAHSDGLAEGILKSGIRGIYCYGAYRNPTYRPGDKDLQLERLMSEINGPLNDFHRRNAERIREKYFPRDDGLLRFGIASSEFPYMNNTAAMFEELEWSRTLEPARISVHVGVVANEPINVVRELNNAGALKEDLLFVHGNHLSDEELQMVIDGGASICTTMEPEMTYGAWPVVSRFSKMGGKAAIGIDVLIDFSGDMFAQMRALLNTWRLEVCLANPSSTKKVHQKKALEVATIRGAIALGLDHVTGSLVPGKAADLFLMNTDRLGVWPMTDPYAAVVTYGHQSLVDDVMVAGKFVKRGGVMVGADWPSIKSALSQSREAIRERFEMIPQADIRKIWSSSFKG